MIKIKNPDLLAVLNAAGDISIVNSVKDESGRRCMWSLRSYDTFIPFDDEYIELSCDKYKPNGTVLLYARPSDINIDFEEGCRLIRIHYPGIQEPIELQTYSNIETVLFPEF